MKLTQFGVAILLLSFALSISAENQSTGFCRVRDADIAVTYNGGCVNGLASGEGVATGRDEYRGSFVEGDPQGYGVYTWGSSSRWATQKYEGWWYKGEESGYAELSVSADKAFPGGSWKKEKDEFEQQRYVIRGLWLQGEQVQICESQAGCFANFVSSHQPQKMPIEASDRYGKAEFIEAFQKNLSGDGNINKEQAALMTCALSYVANQLYDDQPGKTLTEVELAAQLGTVLTDELASTINKSGCATGQHQFDFNALKVDIEDMHAKSVSVSGIGMYMMDNFLLKKDIAGTNFILVDINGLGRERKIEILNRCGNPMQGCNVTVDGTVGTVAYQTGIIASSIVIQ